MADNEFGLRYWQDGRVSRRRLLGGAAIGGVSLAAIGLVGCTRGASSNKTPGTSATPNGLIAATPTDGTQDGKPTRLGGILRVQQNPAWPNMDPFGPGVLTLVQGLALGFTVFDHMWYVPTDTGVAELFLATKLEQPDALTLTATLGDAVFHNKPPVNGRKVLASDVEASFKRFREETGIGYDWLHNVMDDITSDDQAQTVTIKQKMPWAWVLTSSNAGSPITSSILPKEILHGYDDLLRKDAIGSGHWTLLSHDNGANPKLRKFDKFRQFAGTKSIAGQPYLDGIDFTLVTDPNAALAAFKAGDLDTIGFGTKADAERTARDLGNKVVVGSDLGRDFFTMMLMYEPPFKDDRVRHAFNLLIDRKEAIQVLEQGSGVPCGPMPPAQRRYVLPDSDPALQEYFKTDVKQAKQLLGAAGFDLNQSYEMKFSNRPGDSALANLLASQFARGGIKLKLTQQDLITWLTTTLSQSQFKLTCFGQLPYEDPDLPLRFYIGKQGYGTNFMKYDDPKVDDAILAAATELNEEARIQKVMDAQRAVIKAWSPMLNIYSPIGYGGRYAYVKGTISGRGSLGLFNRTTWLDKA
ncbi:MAG: ABC transporter substrate-binding protein [Dehalococcoidia bacterium]|nr:ABC transporter substrate-binding protein [Dehalococcoidia bacterium]